MPLCRERRRKEQKRSRPSVNRQAGDAFDPPGNVTCRPAGRKGAAAALERLEQSSSPSSLGRNLMYSYRPRHTQNIMKPANVRKDARTLKSYTEPREADRCLLIARLILQCGHEEPRVYTVCRQVDECMRHPFCVRVYVGRRNR